MVPRLNQILKKTIDLIKDTLAAARGMGLLGLPQELIRRIVVASKIRTTVTKFMNEYDVPGASVAIAYQGRLLFRGAYGSANTGTDDPVTGKPIPLIGRVRTDHLFRIASLSKPITSVAVFRLIEAGKLQLSDTVFGTSGILGTTYGTQPYKPYITQITVQHLLEHTSGWSNQPTDPMFDTSLLSKTQAELISVMLDRGLTEIPPPPTSPPGTKVYRMPGTVYVYLNFGYLVLGRVIEEVSGMSYADYVSQQVLGQCGISDMHIAGDTLAERRTNEVVYYSQDLPTWDPYKIKVSRMDAHGGWIASPTDLARFLVRVDGLPTPPDILTPSSRSTMLTPTTAPMVGGGSPNYAKGWGADSSGNPEHIGDLPGTTGILQRDADGYWFVLLANSRAPEGPSLDSMKTDLEKLLPTIKAQIAKWPEGDPL